ncbi:relaxase/mobilization nuclease-like protein [Bisgaardia hudsonensis]|uniref:Relaxase/mobilization nuclease-like protein n=1 Tax=Bisgaardia hudsonensis TaxID=109472 RepID=A0A4R2MZR7_9PAST|nr:relaxase/mobilization nuclease-like protein [Bisgaardia hudsonensis]
MIVKFFKKRGKGKASSCKACVDYLLKKPDDTAQILQGDPRLSQEIADSLQFKNTYTAGCLSFEEPNISEKDKRKIMASFEKAIFAGLEPEQYNISWVQHTDKGRLELNFVIPNVELTSGKRLQPYYDKADRPIVENFKQVINSIYGLSDPNDPTKKQNMVTKQELPSNKKQALEAITDGLSTLAKAGHINNRQDVIKALENAGFEIARITPKNISIKTDGQNLRLKGAFYEQDFRFSKELPADIEERARQYKRDNWERYQTARKKLDRAITKRQQEFSRKYPNRAEEINKEYRKNVPLTHNNSFINTRYNNFNISSSKLEVENNISRDDRMANINKNSEGSDWGNKARQVQNSTRGDLNLREDRQKLHQHEMGRRKRFDDFGYSTKEKIGINSNGNRNGNIFRESIERIINTARGRAKNFISRVRELTQGKPTNQETILRNQQSIRQFDELNKSLKQAINRKQEEKAQAYKVRQRGFSIGR